jgi:hypothetical protein
MRQALRQEEAEQILVEAARRSVEEAAVAVTNPEISEDRLQSMAEELGISQETLASVLHDREREQLQAQTNSNLEIAVAAERKAFIEHRRAEFLSDLWSYLGVNGMMVGIWFLSTPHGAFWPEWTMLFWGIGLFFHAGATFNTKGEEFDRELEKWRKKRARRAEKQSAKERRQAQ